jgi:hypothetical protein
MNYSALNDSRSQRSNHVEISSQSRADNRASKGIGTALANGLAAARASAAVTYACDGSSAEGVATRSPLPARPALDCYSQEENQYKGDPNEHFKQSTRVGCNRTSRKPCRKEFKKK